MRTHARLLGRQDHAGTASMEVRRDALVAASEVVLFTNGAVRRMNRETGSESVATVGEISVYPNSINTVPGSVQLGIDVRDLRMGNMERLTKKIHVMIASLKKKYGISSQVAVDDVRSPVVLSKMVQNTIASACKEFKLKSRPMNSGATHDAQNMAAVTQTGMIFVPSRNGVSHTPAEWTDWEDVERGYRVYDLTLRKLLSRV